MQRETRLPDYLVQVYPQTSMTDLSTGLITSQGAWMAEVTTALTTTLTLAWRIVMWIVTTWEPVMMVFKRRLWQIMEIWFHVVSVHCKDTRIVVNVGTNKPFSGRIYALGRSETCNVDVINSDTFRLDLTMAGQDCNTQSAVSLL